MSALSVPMVFSNLLKQADALRKDGDWQPFRPGVTAHWLYDEGHSGAACVLLRYEAGARVALHEHLGYEHMLVLGATSSMKRALTRRAASSSTRPAPDTRRAAWAAASRC